jgi:hypothetical protein
MKNAFSIQARSGIKNRRQVMKGRYPIYGQCHRVVDDLRLSAFL